MPHVINGIGTWYSGKRNIVTRKGACESCGQWAELKSYDTTLFFVVIFIPIIPLKSVRVLDQCSACRRHRVIKQAEWNRIKSEAIERALSEVQAKPGDRETAIGAIGAAMGLQDDEAFLGLSSLIEQHAGSDAKTLVALAEGYEYFGHHDAAESSLRRALEAEPTDEHRRKLGVHLLMHGDPGEGATLVEHILRSGDEKHSGVLALAGEAFQAAGRHEEALAMFDRACVAFPALAKDKGVIRARKTSTKLRASGKPVKIAYIHAKDPKRVTERPWTAKLPWLIGPAIGVGLLAWGLGAAWWIGENRLVYVLSGVSKPYTAEIGGRMVAVPPHGHVTVRVPEGDVRVRIVRPEPMASRLGEETIRIATPFVSRPFTSPVFVVNPDRLAQVEWEETEYLPPNAPAAGRHSERVSIGRTLHSFDDVDYAFQTFPATISMDKHSKGVTKTRVDIALHGDTTDRLRQAAREGGGLEAAVAYARRGVQADPDDGAYAEALMSISPTKETADILRPLLEDKPVRLAIHRAYQECVGSSDPSADLAGEYRARLAKDPGNHVLEYLLGRMVADHAEAARLWQSAMKDPGASSYAAGAMAYDLLAMGDCRGALEVIDRAPQGSENAERLEHYKAEALDGLGRAKEALALPLFNKSLDDMDYADTVTKVYYTTVGAGRAAGEKLVDEIVGTATLPEHQEGARRLRGDLRVLIDYVEGNDRPMAAQAGVGGDNGANEDFEVLLAKGDLEAAAGTRQAQSDWTARLEVMIAATLKGNTKLADEQAAKVAEAMRHGGRERRMVAGWLSGETVPAPGAAKELRLLRAEKAALLVALGQRMPERRAECFEMAKKLNFDRRPPHLLLKRAIEPDQPTGAGAGARSGS